MPATMEEVSVTGTMLRSLSGSRPCCCTRWRRVRLLEDPGGLVAIVRPRKALIRSSTGSSGATSSPLATSALRTMLLMSPPVPATMTSPAPSATASAAVAVPTPAKSYSPARRAAIWLVLPAPLLVGCMSRPWLASMSSSITRLMRAVLNVGSARPTRTVVSPSSFCAGPSDSDGPHALRVNVRAAARAKARNAPLLRALPMIAVLTSWGILSCRCGAGRTGSRGYGTPFLTDPSVSEIRHTGTRS